MCNFIVKTLNLQHVSVSQVSSFRTTTHPSVSVRPEINGIYKRINKITMDVVYVVIRKIFVESAYDLVWGRSLFCSKNTVMLLWANDDQLQGWNSSRRME